MSKIRIKDIAAELGLSPTTVSMVLNGRDNGIAAETRERVVRTASEMGYRKLPRPDVLGWTRVVYVASQLSHFNSHTSFYAGVWLHLQRQAMERQVDPQLHELDLAKGEDAAYRQLQEIRGLGADVFVAHEKGLAAWLHDQGMPVILSQGGRLAGVLCVYCDDLRAGQLVAEHALEMGHRRAGMVFPEGSAEHPRRRGFREAFKAGGGKCPKRYDWLVPHDHGKMVEVIRAKAERYRRLPSFFYCFADNVMFPVIRGLALAGLRIPDDVSVMGTDNLYWGAYTTPAFSTVDLMEEEFAARLLDAVIHVKDGGLPYELAVPVRLLPRETVSAYFADAKSARAPEVLIQTAERDGC